MLGEICFTSDSEWEEVTCGSSTGTGSDGTAVMTRKLAASREVTRARFDKEARRLGYEVMRQLESNGRQDVWITWAARQTGWDARLARISATMDDIHTRRVSRGRIDKSESAELREVEVRRASRVLMGSLGKQERQSKKYDRYYLKLASMKMCICHIHALHIYYCRHSRCTYRSQDGG